MSSINNSVFSAFPLVPSMAPTQLIAPWPDPATPMDLDNYRPILFPQATHSAPFPYSVQQLPPSSSPALPRPGGYFSTSQSSSSSSAASIKRPPDLDEETSSKRQHSDLAATPKSWENFPLPPDLCLLAGSYLENPIDYMNLYNSGLIDSKITNAGTESRPCFNITHFTELDACLEYIQRGGTISQINLDLTHLDRLNICSILRKLSPNPATQTSDTVAKLLGKVVSIKLHAAEYETSYISSIVRNCPNLKSITLPFGNDGVGLTNQVFDTLHDRCLELESLDMPVYYGQNEALLKILTRPKINLFFFGGCTSDLIIEVLKTHPVEHLKVFSLLFGYEGPLSNNFFEAAAVLCGPHLRTFDMNACKISKTGLKAMGAFFAACPNLDSLTLCHIQPHIVGLATNENQLLAKAVKATLANCSSHLKRLKVAGFLIDDIDLRALGEKCRQIESLSIHRNCATNNSLNIISKKFPKIHDLELLGWPSDSKTDQEIINCLKNLPLKILSQNREFSCELSRCIAEYFPNLEFLALSIIPWHNNKKHLSALAKGCPHLRELHLSSFSQNMSDPLIKIAKNENLQWLVVKKLASSQRSDWERTVDALKQACPTLKCTAHTDDGKGNGEIITR